jgi:peptide chain release factor 3
MAAESRRGISVSSAVMSFEGEELAFNLLDPPAIRICQMRFQRGHLPHLDRSRQRGGGARRRLAPRGIEEQTRKLFEVCLLRDVPARAATRSTCSTRWSNRSRST